MSMEGIVQQGTGELTGSSPVAPNTRPAKPRQFGFFGELALKASAVLVLLFLSLRSS